MFTATYNMGYALHRVYESLCNQTFRDFEWIIVDDGSSDNTKDLVHQWEKQGIIDIKFYFQENSGKYIARNKALRLAEGELFTTMDADDRFAENALEVFYNAWKSIPNTDGYSGMACPTIDGLTGERIGGDFPEEVFDSNDLEVKYVFNLKDEKWGACKTSVLREFLFPELEGQKFFLESFVWNQIATKYVHRYINIPLRYYYQDTTGSLSKIPNRFKYPLTHYMTLLSEINIAFEYLVYHKKLLFWKFIDLARFAIHSNKSIILTFLSLNSYIKKSIFLIVLPLSVAYSFRDKLKGRV